MNEMNRNEIAFEVLENTGLNWRVVKQELYFQKDDQKIAMTERHQAMVRNDNNTPLGVVSSKYEPLQNQDAVHLLLGAGAEHFNKDANFIHPWNNTGKTGSLGSFGNVGGGSLNNGEKIFLQLELDTVQIGRSGLNRYITVTNSHDGRSSLGFGTTNQVVCCENTFAMANRKVAKFRHSASLQERLDVTMKNFERALQLDKAQLEVFNKLSEKAIEKGNIQDTVIAVFGQDITKMTASEVSTQKINQAKNLANDIEKSIGEQGATLWALFNGVTRYTNHSTTRKDKVESLLFGNDAKIADRMFKQALSWLDMTEKDLVAI